MQELTLKQAQNYILQNQLLSKSSLKGISGAKKAIEKISYVQIDTISVVARAHHHVLWTRVPDYQLGFLNQLLEGRQIFDYWAHAAAFLPIEDYRFSLYRKKEYQAGKGHWYEKDQKLMQTVLDKFKAEGELMSRDFQKGDFDGKKTAWVHHPINRALRQLFMEGKIMISRRKGFQKSYDLPERILPNSVNQEMPSKKEYYQHLIRRDIGAQGIIKAREIGYLLKKFDRSFLKNLLKTMVKDGELAEVNIKGLEETYFAFSDDLKNVPKRSFKPSFHILSPFDNLIIQRKRLSEIFNYNFKIECYLPAAKRTVGYFGLPILYGTDFLGQIDLKTDRKQQILLIKNLVWENNFKPTDEILEGFGKKLVEFAKFNNCHSIKDEKGVFRNIEISE